MERTQWESWSQWDQHGPYRNEIKYELIMKLMNSSAADEVEIAFQEKKW